MKTILITGANRGIGREIACQLAALGWHVILGVRNVDSIGGLLDELKQSEGKVDWVQLDLNDSETGDLVTGLEKITDSLDVLINNAGVLLDQGVATLDMDDDVLRQTLETNVFGTARITRALVPFLKRSSDARIINLSSRAGQLETMADRVMAPAYQISKTALNALTCLLAGELHDEGIAVNCMSPGWCRTDMGGAEATRSAAEGADTAVWLATEATQSLTGKFICERVEIPW